MKTIDLLAQLQSEQRTNHVTLVDKVDAIAAQLATHALDDTARFASLDKRITPIESMRATIRWSVGVLFGAAIVQALVLVAKVWKP